MAIELDLQRAGSFEAVPDDAQFLCWAQAVLADRPDAELTVRIVDREESRQLNSRYRNKAGPTNVLSFPSEIPAEIELPLLGDVVICAPLVAEEAEQQGKDPMHHWAHLTVHGILHLLGFEHEEESQAVEMEARETQLLDGFGIPNPYL